MTGPYRWINLAEAALWILLGLGIAGVTLLRKPTEPGTSWARLGVPLVLIAFGLSDIVETQTGAWWRPWWLLLWKGLCIVALVAFALRHISATRAATRR